MSAARAVLIIFFHSIIAIFTADNVENHEKTRNLTGKYVDNYVDGVDRSLNMHKNRKNIYTSALIRFFAARACKLRHDCKKERKNATFARSAAWLLVAAIAQPNRNRYTPKKDLKCSM